MNFKYLIPSVLSTCLIIYISSIPDQYLPGTGSLNAQIISNLAHIPAYGLLTFLWLKAFDRGQTQRQFMMGKTLILIGLVLFAVLDEIHQSFVPGRTASCADLGLDVVGILLGLCISRNNLRLITRLLWSITHLKEKTTSYVDNFDMRS